MSAAGFSLGLGSPKASTDVCLGVEASSQAAQCKQLSQHAALLNWQKASRDIFVIWKVIFS